MEMEPVWLDHPTEEKLMDTTGQQLGEASSNSPMQPSLSSRSLGMPQTGITIEDRHELMVEHETGSNAALMDSSQSETNGLPGKKTAASRLFEACAANNWFPPSFELCEGTDHLRMFTYKVIVEVETISSTLLECFSEPRPEKKAAQEHAAEGALWYLNHLGYLPKSWQGDRCQF